MKVEADVTIAWKSPTEAAVAAVVTFVLKVFARPPVPVPMVASAVAVIEIESADSLLLKTITCAPPS
jgi:hypothetical protein